jgi:tRNA U34 5-carboxymethylaminomethyl modifying GTPase MnmE/TrmE
MFDETKSIKQAKIDKLEEEIKNSTENTEEVEKKITFVNDEHEKLGKRHQELLEEKAEKERKKQEMKLLAK